MAVPGSGAHHGIGLTGEVVVRNRVRWSAAQLSNESALPCTTDSDCWVCARRARLCVWIGLTNLFFIDESMEVQIKFYGIYYMELLMGSI